MIKKMVVLLAIMSIYTGSYACDLCSIYLGVNPNDNSNTLGVRYRYRLFENDIHTDEGEKYKYSEAYNEYSVNGSFYLNHKLKLGFNASFSDNYQKRNDSIADNIAGIGDLSLLLQYHLINSKKTGGTTATNNFLHRLTVGGGIVLPTGHYNKISSPILDIESHHGEEGHGGGNHNEGEIDPHLQAGTGAVGGLITLEYFIKYHQIGINTNLSYKFNTTNKNEFRFANRFNANVSAFGLIKISENIKVMPKTGLNFESSNRDELDNEHFSGSGGCVLFANLGMNIFIKKIGIDVLYYEPVVEELLDDQPLNQKRVMVQLNYYF